MLTVDGASSIPNFNQKIDYTVKSQRMTVTTSESTMTTNSSTSSSSSTVTDKLLENMSRECLLFPTYARRDPSG